MRRLVTVRSPMRLALGAVVLLLAATASARAGSGSTILMPNAGVKAKTGLRLEVDTEWADGTGYRPLTIRVSPLGGGAAAADRLLRVSIAPRSWQWSAQGSRVSTWIELPQGATVAEKTIPILQHDNWGSATIEVYEDGDECEDLSGTFGIAAPSYYEWTEAAPSMLFLDADLPLGGRGARFTRPAKKDKTPQRLPDIRVVGSSFLPQAPGTGLDADDFDTAEDADDNDILQLADQLARLQFRRPSELPTNWVALTSIDLIFLSLGELQQLERDTIRFEALRRWLSTGPTLCVYGAGEQFERLPVLERLLQLPAGEPGAEPTRRGWHAPDVRNYAEVIHSVRNVNWQNQWNTPLAQVARAKQPMNDLTPLRPNNPRPFLMRQVEMGRVVAIASDDPFPGLRADWCWLFNSLSDKEWMWYQRHGLSFHRENREYWNLLIPGVGDAPVNSFLVLISLFVVVIGPVNYFMLQRRRRLFMLLLTVPLGAGIVTASLLTYAVVNDGLGVRLRARSLTTIDQANGRAVTWSRQSYYAGLAPSAGMTFPTDAAVYPLVHRTRGRYGEPIDFGRRVNWDDEQNLQRGFLNSRSTAQVLVIEPRQTEARLVVDEGAAAGDSVRVTNQLGVVIQGLVLCDSQRRHWGCARLPDGSTLQTYRIDGEQFPKQWLALFAAHRPAYPIGFDPDQVENASAVFGNQYYGGWRVDQSLPTPTTGSSLLERGMREAAGLRLRDMPARTYLAIVETAPQISLGIKSVQEENSFHVVRGSW